ncbi:MAG: hypothetical protein QOJ99_2860, partial [Bryobacterales bacterium]|nr:hypothetical protein [Bryobacterales bacterium]
DVDWFRAEKQLLSTTQVCAAPALLVVARALGSTLGVVARFVLSLQ